MKNYISTNHLFFDEFTLLRFKGPSRKKSAIIEGINAATYNSLVTQIRKNCVQEMVLNQKYYSLYLRCIPESYLDYTEKNLLYIGEESDAFGEYSVFVDNNTGKKIHYKKYPDEAHIQFDNEEYDLFIFDEENIRNRALTQFTIKFSDWIPK